jgi:ABC-2 type transport system ATP-binding protein
MTGFSNPSSKRHIAVIAESRIASGTRRSPGRRAAAATDAAAFIPAREPFSTPAARAGAPGARRPDERHADDMTRVRTGRDEADGEALLLAGVSVRRGGRDVVRDVGLHLRRGTVCGLLGPSGCGKTSLMRAIVGVQREVRGRIEVLGLPAGATELRRRVGYVTQAPSVYGDLTVSENLRFFARVLGVSRERADAVIDEVDLSAAAGQLVRSLSGGQQARVSLATALVGNPDLLILDEPTVGLDPLLRRDLWGLFHRLADTGATLLVSSHVMDEAGRCDELVLMRDGAILIQASPGDLLHRTGASDIEDAFLRLVEAP